MWTGTALGVTFWPRPAAASAAAAESAEAAAAGCTEHRVLIEVDRQILAVVAVGDGALEVGEDAAQNGAAREQLRRDAPR